MLRARVELARLFGTGISNLRVCRFHHLSVVLEAGLEPARPSVRPQGSEPRASTLLPPLERVPAEGIKPPT